MMNYDTSLGKSRLLVSREANDPSNNQSNNQFRYMKYLDNEGERED